MVDAESVATLAVLSVGPGRYVASSINDYLAYLLYID
jgi:hypothetical protein